MGALEEIKHVVVLMLENHSYDHLFGYLTLPDPSEVLGGLTGREANPIDPQNPAGEKVQVSRVTSPTSYVTDPDPGHQFDDVTLQLFGQGTAPIPVPVPANDGFVAS